MLDDVASIKTDTLRTIRRALLVARSTEPADGEVHLLAQPYLALLKLLPTVAAVEAKIAKHAPILPMAAAALAKARAEEPERYGELVGLVGDLGYGEIFERVMAPLIESSGSDDPLVIAAGAQALKELMRGGANANLENIDELARRMGFEVHERPAELAGDDEDEGELPSVIDAARALEAAAIAFAQATAAFDAEADAKGAVGDARRDAVSQETDDRLVAAQHELLGSGTTYEQARVAASEADMMAIGAMDEHGMDLDGQRWWKQAIADTAASYGLRMPPGRAAEIYDRLFTRVDELAAAESPPTAAPDAPADDVRVV